MERDEHLDAGYLAEELEVAKKYIKDLEARLEKRENELRNTQQRVKKSFRRKDRRNGILNQADIPIQTVVNDSSQSNHETADSVALGDYILLTIVGFEQPSNKVSHSLPLYIRACQGKSYVVGPEGVTIGSGEYCGIKFPTEVGLHDCHAKVKMKMNPERSMQEYVIEMNAAMSSGSKTSANFSKVLYNGCNFKTSWVLWRVTAIPKRNLVQSKLFAAVRNKDCPFFLRSIQELDKWNSNIETTKDYIHLDMVENKQYRVAQNKLSCSSNAMSQYITEIFPNDQYSLLHVAVDYNCVDIVYKLLRLKVNVNLTCGNRKLTPLHLACKQSSIKLVGLLLKNGANIEITDSNNKDAISMTELYPIKKQLMLSHHLCLASYGGDHTEIESIFSSNNGICVDVIGFKGYTALQLACMNGHVLCARALLQNNAEVNMSCYKYNCTPLHYACIGNHTDIISLLIDNGALQTAVDWLGYTPIQLVRSCNAYDLLNQACETSLCIATQIGDLEEVSSILLKHTVEEDFKIAPDLLRKKISTGKYGRKTSRQMIFQNLGLCALIDQPNEKGLSPIHLAAAAGDIEIIKLLLSYGAKIDFPGGLEKQTALFFSCLSGRTECVNFLLMMGADQEFCDARGMQCLDYVEDRIKILKDKLEENRSTATVNQNFDAPESLIPPQYVSRLNVCNSFLNTPSELRHQLQRFYSVLNVLRSGQQNLYEALKAEDYLTLEGLLKEDEVNVNRPLSRVLPITALNYASSLGLERATELLLLHEANPYIQDGQSYTPIHTASESGYGNIVRILLHHGIDVNLQTAMQKSTCLHLAARRNHKSVVEILLSAGADTAIRDIDGNTAFDLTSDLSIQSVLAEGDEKLYVALQLDDVNLVQTLLHEIDVNVNFRDHVTPLHVVCERGSLPLCKLLIDRGARINVVGGVSYSTPLHYAARSSSPDIIRLLVECGADLTLQDNNGKTPFEVASNNTSRQAIIHGKKDLHRQQDISMNVDRDDVCKICFSNPVDTMVLPCGHATFCSTCVAQIQTCALDRQTIVDVKLLPKNPANTHFP